VSASTPSFRETIPRGLLILVGMATATIAVMGMKAIAGIITPSFLALVLVICVQPLRGWLIRKGLPRWLAAVAVVLSVYLIIILMITATVVCLAKLATLAPSYTSQANDLANKVVTQLKDFGVDQSQVNDLAKNLDFGRLFGLATTILSSILNILSDLLFIGLVTLFLAFDNDRFVRILGETEGERPSLVTALNKFASSTRTYFIVATIFGFIVAVIDTGALWLLGIPAAMVWGVLAFVTNFIPNIGFIIGLVPPAILGLLQGGWGLAVAVIVVYCVINFVIQSVLQPKFQGDALGLTTTLTFLSLVFWTFVLGPLGAILALPMTLLAKALIVDVDPDNVWMAPLLSGISKSEEGKEPGGAPGSEDAAHPGTPPSTSPASTAPATSESAESAEQRSGSGPTAG
jgi:predicted PurR-regulated permease PerM